MLTVICGEDTVASRNYLHEILEKYKSGEYEVHRIPVDQLEQVTQEGYESLSLFGMKKVYVLENLNRTIKRGESEKLLKTLQNLKEIELIDWEDGVSKRELKLLDYGTVKEFKLSENIFQLLDACFPTNLKRFLELFESVRTAQNEMFLYIMLVRHVRNLLLVKMGNPPSHLQSWQVAKLKKQTSYWDKDDIIDFFEKLIGLEIGLKTGKNPYGLAESIEILVCYYIK